MSKTVWKKGLDLRDESGIYSYGGRKYISVTSALGIHGDFLWVHKYAIKDLVGKLSLQVESGEMHSRWIEVDGQWIWADCNPMEALTDAKYVSEAGARYMKSAADTGTCLHDCLEDYANGLRMDPSDHKEIYQYAEQKVFNRGHHVDIDKLFARVGNLILWLNDVQPVIIASEIPGFNDTHKFAGRLDLMACIGDDLWVLDMKSSTDYRRTWGAQVGAYANFEFYLIGDSVSTALEVDMPKGLRAGIIMCDDDRCGLREVDNYQLAYDKLFLTSLDATRLSSELPLPKSKANFPVNVKKKAKESGN